LESYEDTLENVTLQSEDHRDDALELFADFRREFVPSNLLADEVRSNPAYLLGSALASPKGVTLTVLSHDGKRTLLNADLSETLSIWFGIVVESRKRSHSVEITVGWIREERCALVIRDVSTVDSAAVARHLKESLGEGSVKRLIINGDVSIQVLRENGIAADVELVEELLVAQT
jgi:hypothetical protein